MLDLDPGIWYPTGAEGSGMRGAFFVAHSARPRTSATFSKSAALGSGPRSLEGMMALTPDEKRRRDAEKRRRWYYRHREEHLAKLRAKTAAGPKAQERNRRKRQRDQIKAWRDEAFSRDGYRCVDCGKSEGLLLHHLDGRSKDSTIRTEGTVNNRPENLVTLCFRCHTLRHEHDPTLPLDERLRRKRRSIAERTEEEARAIVRKASETMGSDGLSARSRAAWANLTPEQRTRRIRNAAEARQRVRDAKKESH